MTNRQIAVLEQTLGWDRVLLSGALGSGKTLICILKINAAIEAAPLTTKVLFWVVSCREGRQDEELKLFEKVRTAVGASLSKDLRKKLDMKEVIDCRFISEHRTEVNDTHYFQSYRELFWLIERVLHSNLSLIHI